MTNREALRFGYARLQNHVARPDVEALCFLADTTARSQASCLANPEDILSSDQELHFTQQLERRAGGEPLAYIRGQQEFLGRDFFVDPGVLIPRPTTEELVQFLLTHTDESPTTVIDVGCGSGCIAVSLALARPEWHVIAVDQSPQALTITKKNASQHGADIDIRQSDLLQAVPESINIIVANLPYLKPGQMTEQSIQAEPREALLSEPNGLGHISRLLIEISRSHSEVRGVILECDKSQGAEVVTLIQNLHPIRVEELRANETLYGVAAWFR